MTPSLDGGVSQGGDVRRPRPEASSLFAQNDLALVTDQAGTRLRARSTSSAKLRSYPPPVLGKLADDYAAMLGTGRTLSPPA